MTDDRTRAPIDATEPPEERELRALFDATAPPDDPAALARLTAFAREVPAGRRGHGAPGAVRWWQAPWAWLAIGGAAATAAVVALAVTPNLGSPDAVGVAAGVAGATPVAVSADPEALAMMGDPAADAADFFADDGAPVDLLDHEDDGFVLGLDGLAPVAGDAERWLVVYAALDDELSRPVGASR